MAVTVNDSDGFFSVNSWLDSRSVSLTLNLLQTSSPSHLHNHWQFSATSRALGLLGLELHIRLQPGTGYKGDSFPKSGKGSCFKKNYNGAVGMGDQ